MARSVTPHLMFEGSAEEAITVFVYLFPGASVVQMERYPDGKVKLAIVDCEGADELERVFARLSKGGQVFMPLDNYGFSRRFGSCSDRFGVSWQLNLR